MKFYSPRLLSLTNCKLKISRYGVQYSLQRQLETGTNVDRKRTGALKMTTAFEYKHLIIKSKT